MIKTFILLLIFKLTQNKLKYACQMDNHFITIQKVRAYRKGKEKDLSNADKNFC